MESLKGIFPQTQPPPKRDFLRENVQRIRQMQRVRKPSKDTEYSNRYNKQVKPRRISLCESNGPSIHRSVNSLALCSTKAPLNNLRKSVSHMSIQQQKECGTQTVDPNDDFFLKDSIIRYPSASTLRSAPSLQSIRPPSAHQSERTCSKGHQMEPFDEPTRPRFRSHYRNEKTDRHLSNLSEFLEKGSISKKQPPSILKNSASSLSSKSIKNYMNNLHHGGDRSETKSETVSISDDEDDEAQKEKRSPPEKELAGGDARAKQLKEAEDDPDCPDGHVPLPENERLDALKLAKKRFKELVDDLNRLPMTSETLRVRNKKIEIEKELRTIELNMRVFSRNKVYVKLD